MIQIDLLNVLSLFEILKLGTYKSEKTDSSYTTIFYDNNGNKVGYTKATSGVGFQWDYPQDVIDAINIINTRFPDVESWKDVDGMIKDNELSIDNIHEHIQRKNELEQAAIEI